MGLSVNDDVLWTTLPVVVGLIFGSILPGSSYIEDVWLRTLSSVLGWIYFACWSASFYPQVFTNHRRKSVQGLSIDFQVLNVLGFFCYSVYNCALYWSVAVREDYIAVHGHPPGVHINDVVFSLHGFFLTCISLTQCYLYENNLLYRVSHGTIIFCASSITASVGMAIFLLIDALPHFGLRWISFIYLLSYIKLIVTLVKYMPQIILNYQRKSTVGWSLHQVLLDAEGGLFSLAQQILDVFVTKHSSSITGNITKFGLGIISLSFDSVLMVQHWLVYPDTAVHYDSLPS
jgi:cystinosin